MLRESAQENQVGVELSKDLVPLEGQDVVCNAYHWRMPTDDPTFIYAINSATGCNAFDCRINRGLGVDQEAVNQIAKLMFAAPDLLAACEALPLSCKFEDAADYKDNAMAFDRAMQLARAAISKAKAGAT